MLHAVHALPAAAISTPLPQKLGPCLRPYLLLHLCSCPCLHHSAHPGPSPGTDLDAGAGANRGTVGCLALAGEGAKQLLASDSGAAAAARGASGEQSASP